MTSNGYRWQGEMIGKQLAETFLWGMADRTVIDRAITVEGSKVCIDYEVPVPPLVADTYTVQAQPNYGFSVYVDGVGVTVEKAEVQNTRVVLTCGQELHGKVAVKYAGNAVGDREHRGIGNIRDSDRYTSLYLYADDTNETSSAGNTVDYRPKTADGESLSGKHYPLCNWASHAYREIIVSAIPATDFTPKLSGSKASVGDILTLNVSYTPANANSGLGVTWKVSDSTKAKLENGKLTILGGSNNDTVTVTGTLANGVERSVSVTIVVSDNPYAAYYGYWDFTGGSAANKTTAKNLATKKDDSILVNVNGTESGYLTGDGLTLAANSAVKIPVVSGMPDGIEIYMDFTIPASLYGTKLNNKGFVSLAKGTANRLSFGSEMWGFAWPSIVGVAEGKTAEAECAWRYATDAGGTSLGNTYMWWGDQSLHQHLRLRLNTSGGGEFAMQANTDGDNWHTWTLPAYAGAQNKHPGFKAFKSACDAILLGNRATLNFGPEGLILHSAYIKEYNG